MRAAVFLLASIGAAAEPQSLIIATQQLELSLDPLSGELQAVSNRRTGTKKTVRDVAFTILSDRGIVRSRDIRLVNSQRSSQAAEFRFEGGGLMIELAYRVRSPEAHYVEKILRITNGKNEAITIDSLVLMEVSFSPAPAHVKFHTAGIHSDHPAVSPDVPLAVFLRERQGGIFLGIENPYFSYARNGSRLSLQFRPRWRLKPGENFESEPAFLGVYKNEGVYAFKATRRGSENQPAPYGAQELFDWGEVWAMQDFMREVLTTSRPPGDGYPVIYNACGGMEYLWRLRESPAKFTPEGRLIPGVSQAVSEDDRQFVKEFAGSSPWTKEIVHGAFRPAWIEPFRLLIDHLGEVGHVDILHPGTLWMGNGGFWDKELGYLSGKLDANPHWLQTVRYARQKRLDVYGFECPASGYFRDRTEWKYISREGKASGANCYANRPFVDWHRETMSRVIREHGLPWWQWDEGWADVAGGECYATTHDHPPGNVSYAVYRNIQQTTAELKRRHPATWLVGISVFQHHVPWILRAVDESVTWADPWYAHNYLFVPPGKNYIGDWLPRNEEAEFDLLRKLSLADHLSFAQPIWFADFRRRERAQAFWRQWLSWAGRNAQFLRARRDLFGPHGTGGLEGSAHIAGDHGFIFLFNHGAETSAGSIPLNDWIGVRKPGMYGVREIYPQSSEYGVYARGDDLVLEVAAKQAVVLELAPTDGPRKPGPRAANLPRIQKAFMSLEDLLSQWNQRDLWPVYARKNGRGEK